MKKKLLLPLFLITCLFGFSQIPAYYSSIDFTQSGNALKAQLATLITNTHTTSLSYSPGVWDALKQTDLNPNNSAQVFLVYGYNDFDAVYKNDRTDDVNNICSSSCPTGAWNREHCYPKSLGNPDLGTSGPGSDPHHIRAADVTFNADRGNRLYTDGEGDAGPVSTFWYPGDEWKGDIARMMMYMYVRYDSRCLANNVASSPNTYHVDMPDIFLEWNEEDPVNFYEMNRNNIIEGLQGNRNPFIDNPYLATRIWGGPQAPDSWNMLSCPSVTTWNGFSWDNGVPNKDTRAVVNGDLTSSGDLEFCSLDITGTAQVVLQTGDTFTVVRAVNIASTANFTIQNNANLIQINNVSNSGNITYLKNSASILRLDYTSWGAPVSGQNLQVFSPQTLPNRFYEYIPSGNTPLTAYAVVDPSVNDFVPTKGYVIRAPNNWSSSVASPYMGQFVGVPNNGDYTTSVEAGYNMLGNPYPATIEASHFIASNRTIETLYFWTHTVAASGGSYPQNNFASYTTLGGVAAAAGGLIPDGTIKPGQGFYVNSSENETVLFHNALRYDVKNSQFFRNQAAIVTNDVYRLNLIDSEKAYNQILIGYSEKATNDFDLGIDGKVFDRSNSRIYSVLNSDELVINGRSSFRNEDKVILGFVAKNSGYFTIELENGEGLFTDQTIYLKDNFTGSIVDVTKQSYSFLSEEGVFNDRFELVYKKDNLELMSNTNVVAYSTDNAIHIHSEGAKITSVVIYDTLGRKLFESKKVDNEILISGLLKSNQTLILNIELEDGNTIKKKIIH